MRTPSSVVGTSRAELEPPQDRVLWPTRVLAAAIIPFLLVAFCVLFPVPTDTRRLFAWQIRPTMTPMVLGAVYLGGAYFFARWYGPGAGTRWPAASCRSAASPP